MGEKARDKRVHSGIESRELKWKDGWTRARRAWGRGDRKAADDSDYSNTRDWVGAMKCQPGSRPSTTEQSVGNRRGDCG
eukprot:3639866-Pleurochrysis_carterae.AAC.1